MKHQWFERLFENNSPSKGLLTPFGIDALDSVDMTDTYFNDTVYRQSIEVASQKALNYVNLIERAIVRVAMPVIFPELTGFGGYGFDKAGNFYCDYYDGTVTSFNSAFNDGITNFAKERHIVLRIDDKGTLAASIVDEWGGETPYLIKTRNQDGSNRHSASAAIFAVIAYIIAKHEKGVKTSVSNVMYRHFKDITDGYISSDMASFMKGMRALDADFYTLFAYPEKVEKKMGSLPVNPANFDVVDIPVLDITAIEELDDMVGDSEVLKGEKRNASRTVLTGVKKVKTIKELTADDTYELGMTLKEAEKNLIPTGFDDFVPSDITLDVAMEIKASSFDRVPARNFLWTGETGTGKTTESQMLAALLKIPYRSMNLSSDKLSSDILVSCLPNNTKANKAELESLIASFPDAETIAVNPAIAYESITGIKKEDATEKEINDAKTKAIYDLLSKANDFMYVDSPFVETFRNGGVVELQECNSCKAAILKSLNEALDDLNIIHLPTGEVVHRNPNCIVVVTANVGQGYEGINNFSNDFIARFHQADVFELPDDKVLIQRVKERSGYSDETVIAKMIKVMHAIQRELLETKGDYGSCSPRGLIAWARKTKNCGDAYKAGCKTIVGLATQDPEIRIELLHALETEFAPTF